MCRAAVARLGLVRERRKLTTDTFSRAAKPPPTTNLPACERAVLVRGLIPRP